MFNEVTTPEVSKNYSIVFCNIFNYYKKCNTHTPGELWER